MSHVSSGPQLVNLGEAVFDFTGVGPFTFQGHPGGSPLNTSIAAARQGVAAAVATQLSTDLFGSELLRNLSANGVDTSFIERSDRPSSLAFVVEADGDAHFQFVGEGSSDRFYDPQPRPTFPESVRFICLAPLTCFGEPGHQANVDILIDHRARATIVLDPTVRPALFPDRARWHTLFDQLIPLTHIVKGSDQDLEWLHPDRSIADTAHAWLEIGPDVVIITKGEHGADVYRRGREMVHVDAPRVVVADTIGAGDTFNGTLFASLIASGHDHTALVGYDDAEMRALVSRCAKAAALTCTRPGCDPPTTAEVDAWRP